MPNQPKNQADSQKKIIVSNDQGKFSIDFRWIHTIIIGSGASGLNAAVQLYRNGVKDVLILTEGFDKGTSINTGSDKQTYYKLSICGSENDSPRIMAESYYKSGSMHGDIALVESSLSVRAFMNLVNLGVPFPRDPYGQFAGYKTDHDPRQRATSIGPYTSREMCLRLIDEVRHLGIEVLEDREVIHLVLDGEGEKRRIVGLIALGENDSYEAFAAENIIFAVGGPGGLYKTSVYPKVHNGAIGLALMAGVEACNLPESQYGLASIKFRWNVSGTYMQVVPRFISRAADGLSDEREFLSHYFDDPSEMYGNIFLKGYQWPFNAAKVIGGSSIIDILVYIENVERGRHVYLDFRKNPKGFSLETLPEEARSYLTKSGATQRTPFERLMAMNPQAVSLYEEHGIELSKEPLEIAVCAQHNNGGLSANHWWESTNTKHFFPIGEVNGSHGVNRPGGSALNSGQVGGFRAAEYIANQYANWSIDKEDAVEQIKIACEKVIQWEAKGREAAGLSCNKVLDEIRNRMSYAGAHIRSRETLQEELPKAEEIVRKLQTQGCFSEKGKSVRARFCLRQLAFSHLVYLSAIQFMIENNAGSRGSSVVLNAGGKKILNMLDEKWQIQPEDTAFRKKMLYTRANVTGEVTHSWQAVRPIPDSDIWFETAWAAFRNGIIYQSNARSIIDKKSNDKKS